MYSYFKERWACHFFSILGQKVRPVNSYKSPMLGTRFRFLGGFWKIFENFPFFWPISSTKSDFDKNHFFGSFFDPKVKKHPFFCKKSCFFTPFFQFFRPLTEVTMGALMRKMTVFWHFFKNYMGKNFPKIEKNRVF